LLQLLLPALREYGVESEILTATGSRSGTPLPIKGFELTAFQSSPFARIWAGHSFALPKAIDAKVRQFDVVHIHELWNYPHFAAARSAAKSDIPYVITPHGELDPWAYAHKGFKKRLYMSAIQRRLLSRAAVVQALTTAESDQIATVAADANTTTIPNGLDLSTIDESPKSELSPAVSKFLERYKVITFMGRLHQKKGIEPLIDGFIKAAAKSNDVGLLLVGPDEGGYTAQLNASARAAGLSERVLVAGAINGSERFEVLRRSQAFALTSYSEGFSMAVLESMACSTPVIISPACHFPEAIDAGAGVLTNPHAGDVELAINRVIADDGTRESMGSAGRGLIENRFTIQSTSALMSDMYDRLARPAR
jgi:glycosyltransferase involved in cell wall biosynthesis